MMILSFRITRINISYRINNFNILKIVLEKQEILIKRDRPKRISRNLFSYKSNYLSI